MSTLTKYWPFDVPPVETRSPQENREIEFLQGAAARGFEAYRFGMNDYGVQHDPREGCIFERGRWRWEVRVYDARQQMLSAYVDDFEVASAAVFEWLLGTTAQDVLRHLSEHLIMLPGAKETYSLAEFAKTN